VKWIVAETVGIKSDHARHSSSVVCLLQMPPSQLIAAAAAACSVGLRLASLGLTRVAVKDHLQPHVTVTSPAARFNITVVQCYFTSPILSSQFWFLFSSEMVIFVFVVIYFESV